MKLSEIKALNDQLQESICRTNHLILEATEAGISVEIESKPVPHPSMKSVYFQIRSKVMVVPDKIEP